MNWHPENWYSISEFLAEMLKEALFHEEYALSYYFAYLLLDDNAKGGYA